MDTQTTILILLVLGIPALLFSVAVLYVRSEYFAKQSPNSLYQISILGKSFLVHKHLLIQLALVALLYSWLDLFVPFSIALIAVGIALMAFRIANFESVDSDTLSELSQSLLPRLSKMQSELRDVTQHIEGLGTHLESRQLELEEKETLRSKLDAEIEAKSGEAEFWKHLTDEQRQIVSDAAAAAIPKESRGNIWAGLLFGFFASLLATLAWSLMGNPGREDIIERVQQVAPWSGIGSEQTDAPD